MNRERGSAAPLAALVALALAMLAGVLLLFGVVTARGEAVRGAADLAALAGAQAQATNRDPCEAARRSAHANRAEVTACRVAGDEVEFVVTVEVRVSSELMGLPVALAARANAGVMTGAPS